MGSGTRAAHYHTSIGEWVADVPLHPARYLGAMASGNVAFHCRTTWGQWAREGCDGRSELLQHTAVLPLGNCPCNSCCTLPPFPRPKGRALVHYTAFPRGSVLWDSCNTRRTCLRAVCVGTFALHHRSASRQRVVINLATQCPLALGQGAGGLFLHSATLPAGTRGPKSSKTLPSSVGEAGSGIFAAHYLTTCGRWVVHLMH